MRILTVTNSLSRGGLQRVAQEFSLGYHERGIPVMVLATESSGVREDKLRQAGIPLAIGGPPASMDRALRTVEQFDPDIIHIHRGGYVEPAESELLRVLKAKHRKILETNVYCRIDYSNARKLIDVHLQISRWCLWRWQRWLGWRHRDALGVAIPNPVDVDAFQRASAAQVANFREIELRLPTNSILIGRIGQRDEANWHPATVTAFAKVANVRDHVFLFLIGAPPSCQAAIERLPPHIAKRVIQFPFVDDDLKLSIVYSSFDLFLHAAKAGETFGLVIAEAMLCGCPVVTCSRPHRGNSQLETVELGVGGIAAASTEDLGNALLLMVDNSRERARMASSARESIVRRFDRKLVVDQAVHIAEHTLRATSKTELRRALEADEMLTTHVPDAEIAAMMTSVVGNPNAKEQLIAHLIDRPLTFEAFIRLRDLVASRGQNHRSGN